MLQTKFLRVSVIPDYTEFNELGTASYLLTYLLHGAEHYLKS